MKENRFKVIDMIGGAFPKLTAERLPKDNGRRSRRRLA
jgi:hypothetical protein